MANDWRANEVSQLQTERLILRPFRVEDEEDVLALLRNDEIKLTYMLPDFPTREAAVKLFLRIMDMSHDDAHFERAIVLGDHVIGFLNDVEIEGDMIEVGYVIHPSEKNRGYATEALTATIAELFRRGYGAVRAGFFEGNPASGRVMEKSGMKRMEKIDEIEYRGVVHRCLYYEIRKEN